MIAIVDYGIGNIKSLSIALSRLNCDYTFTDDTRLIQSADKVFIPGVGSAAYGMEAIRSKKLDETIVALEQPVLGICLGLQIMCNYLEEGNVHGLGIFQTDVKRFEQKNIVPHMGWNNINCIEGMNSLATEGDYYFVHSYYAQTCEHTTASCNYGETFSAILQHKNFYAMQFHPEKSSKLGLDAIQKFLKL